MKSLDLVKTLRRDAAFDAAALERGKAVLMNAIRREFEPRRGPTIVPQIPYLDVLAALSFLVRAFGFREIPAARLVSAGGGIDHATLEFAGGVIGIGPEGHHGTVSPRGGGVVSQYISVYVDDVDAHHQRALAAGARVVAPLTDYFWGDEGHRTYEALDPEGHRWRFHQRLTAKPPAAGRRAR
jgi:uncharacterized glyoxalase superfamily protein PhnB